MENTPTLTLSLSLSLYTQIHHYFSASSPPPATNLRRFHHQQNVRRRPDTTMPLRDLTIRRITTNRNNFRFNQATESFSIAERYTSINHRKMAEERKNKDDTTASSVGESTEEKDKASEKSAPTVPPPPPPEKPLPGDCCGSGCVRCVWDVYYEDLEEYNKLHKADSKIS